MRSSLAIVAAASIPLLLSAPRASAGEVPFKAPATDRAQQSQELLSRAAYALNADVSARARSDRDERISNLWIYPTNDANTVFAHYTLTANDHTSAGLSTTQHLDVLTLRGNRIVNVQDLTAASAEGVRSSQLVAAAASDTGNWSAKIGNGHTTGSSHTTGGSQITPTGSQGTPASPHWSASIGTGQAANAASDVNAKNAVDAKNDAPRGPTKLARASVSTSTGAHWTSKIGTAHASESGAETAKGGI